MEGEATPGLLPLSGSREGVAMDDDDDEVAAAILCVHNSKTIKAHTQRAQAQVAANKNKAQAQRGTMVNFTTQTTADASVGLVL